MPKVDSFSLGEDDRSLQPIALVQQVGIESEKTGIRKHQTVFNFCVTDIIMNCTFLFISSTEINPFYKEGKEYVLLSCGMLD